MSGWERKKLSEVSRRLASVATGEQSADVVIQNGILVNVYSGELLAGSDVAIAEGRVALIGDVKHTIGESTQVIDAAGRYIVPGLIDGHMHVESTMLTVTEFAKAALVKGTTAVFMDPHEIANVFGSDGVRWMHEEGQQLPLKVFTTYPSCVPATDGLEDAGAALTVEDIEEGMHWEGVAGLGEVMNFPGVVQGNDKMHGEIEATMRAGKTVTGHFPSDDDRMLQAYIASGVTSDHETVTREQGRRKIQLGMNLMIREGSAWHDVKEVIKVVTEDKMPTDNITLVTDDVYPQTLVELGHLNHVVRRAIEEGVTPVTAIQMATVNTARYFKQDQDLGAIAPGKCADLLLVGDLDRMEPSLVMVDGVIVAEKGELAITLPSYEYPERVRTSVRLARPVTAADFKLPSKLENGARKTKVRAIQAIENSARTGQAIVNLPVVDGFIEHDLQQDVIRLACIERHRASGEISLGFVKGFELKKGAVASTVAHDSHNLLVMGVSEEDMALAANELARCGGGMIAVADGKVLAKVEMPVAGLMSDRPLAEVVTQVQSLEKAWKELGCPLNAPFMTFSLIALPVIPDLRISNRGMVDVTKFELVETEII